ncbi:hypothetical protein ACGVWS_11445 [Enterobacteriaceae bacterium LUAb1]
MIEIPMAIQPLYRYATDRCTIPALPIVFLLLVFTGGFYKRIPSVFIGWH